MKKSSLAFLLLVMMPAAAVADPFDCFSLDGVDLPQSECGDSFIIPILPDLQNYLCGVGNPNTAGCSFSGYEDEENYDISPDPVIMHTMLDFITTMDPPPPYIHQVGDLVMASGMAEEWVYADHLMKNTLESGDSPLLWGISPGNHDGCYCTHHCGGRFGVPKLDWPMQRFDEWFPPSRWTDLDLPEGSSVESMDSLSMDNACFSFAAGGKNWMFINLGFYQKAETKPCGDERYEYAPKNPPFTDVLAWADQKIKSHHALHGDGSIVVLAQHSLIRGWQTVEPCDGDIIPEFPCCPWTGEGLETWFSECTYTDMDGIEQTYRMNENPNLKLMISGHVIENEHGHRVELRDGMTDPDGNALDPVHIIMINYQQYVQDGTATGGHGFMHMMRVSCEGRRADFTTYSPYLDQLGQEPCNISNQHANFSIAMGQMGDVNTDGIVNWEDGQAVCIAMGCTWTGTDSGSCNDNQQNCEAECFHCIEDINGDNRVDGDDYDLVQY